MTKLIISGRQIQGVLFDLDNTLADRAGAFRNWADWFVDVRIARSGSKDFAAACAELEQIDAGGYCPRDEFAQKVLARFPQVAESPVEFVSSFQERLVQFMPPLAAGCVEFLDRLNTNGIPWGIVTNGGPNQLRKIAHLGLDSSATCVLVSAIVGTRKPEPAIFLQAAEALGAPPESILFVGDHPEADILGAARVGMMTAWLHHGTSWPDLYHDQRPDHTIISIGDLIAFVH